MKISLSRSSIGNGSILINTDFDVSLSTTASFSCGFTLNVTATDDEKSKMFLFFVFYTKIT